MFAWTSTLNEQVLEINKKKTETDKTLQDQSKKPTTTKTGKFVVLADLRRRLLYPWTELTSLSTVKINIKQFSSPTTSDKRIT